MSKLEFLKLTFDEQLEAAWNFHNIEKAVFEREIAELRAENETLRGSYNQAIDDAADLLNCVDLPRDELAAVVRKLKK